VVGTRWQGQGIATEAARALISWLGTQSVNTVIAHIHPRHQASAVSRASLPQSRQVHVRNLPTVLIPLGAQVLYEDDGTRKAVDGKRMAAVLGEKRVILLKNHGAVIASQSLEQATIEAMMLEVAARYHIEAEAVGGDEFPVAEVVRGKAQYRKYFLPNMWEANLRRLRQSDPELFAAAG